MSDTTRALIDQLDEIVQGLGFRVVELNTSVVKGRTHCHLVIYRSEGVGIDDCATVHRTVLPRLELLWDDRDVALQVASPGIERTMKDMRELGIFVDRGVRILRKHADDWITGIIRGADADRVEVETEHGVQEIAIAEIQKAKLDYSQEVR